MPSSNALGPEAATDDTPAEVMEIVCEVHQDAGRLAHSGIGLTIPGTEQPLVLDFENAASLQSTIDAVTGQTSPPWLLKLLRSVGSVLRPTAVS
ncbi:MAG: hypothetical protein R3C56_28830 [Pirellulaceae bacterium]